MKKRVLIIALVLVVAMLMTTALLSANSDVALHLIERQGADGGGCLATGTANGLAIPDNDPVGVCFDITVGGAPAGATIVDVNVALSATHTWVGDLIFSLEHVDTATTVSLMDRPGVPASTFGCSGDNVSTTFDDEGADGPVEAMCGVDPAIFGSPVPEQPLSGFDGQTISDTWTLCASDNAGGDTGSVTAATLNIACTAPVGYAIAMTKTVGLDPNVCATTDSIQIPAGYGGTEVTYCYTMRNNSTTTVTHHTVNDDQLGTLLNGFPFPVAAGNGAYFTVTALITETTVNSATWLVYDGSPTTPPVASASDTATVTRGEPTDVSLSSFGSQAAALSPVWLAAAVVLVIGLGLALRRKFNNA